MSIIERNKQALADLDYIERKYGFMRDKDDYLKGELTRLLEQPNRNVAFEIIYDQLVTLFQKGYVFRVQTLGGEVIKPLPLSDSKIEEIQLRWDLPTPPHTI